MLLVPLPRHPLLPTSFSLQFAHHHDTLFSHVICGSNSCFLSVFHPASSFSPSSHSALFYSRKLINPLFTVRRNGIYIYIRGETHSTKLMELFVLFAFGSHELSMCIHIFWHREASESVILNSPFFEPTVIQVPRHALHFKSPSSRTQLYQISYFYTPSKVPQSIYI